MNDQREEPAGNPGPAKTIERATDADVVAKTREALAAVDSREPERFDKLTEARDLLIDAIQSGSTELAFLALLHHLGACNALLSVEAGSDGTPVQALLALELATQLHHRHAGANTDRIERGEYD